MGDFTVIDHGKFQDTYRVKRSKPVLKKKSRVSDLFAQFEKLSQVEKINFINLLQNYG